MAQVGQSKSSTPLKKTTERILSLAQLTRQEYSQMTSLLLSSHKISVEERRLINRIFDSVKQGAIQIID